MLRRHRARRRRPTMASELDITPFMNLMVILVPFLLITAVFSRVTVMDLFLPNAGDADSTNAPPFQLQIVIRQSQLEISDNRGGLIKRLATDKAFDYQRLTEVLIQIKSRRPTHRQVNLLLEPDVSYDRLVQVMDHARMARQGKDYVELFPDVSLGDAPRPSGGGRR